MARRRSKNTDTPVEYEGMPTTPRYTPDGETWLDPKGNAPEVDTDGKLVKSFVFQLAFGGRELWGVGMKLPDTPAVLQRQRDAYEAKLAVQQRKAGK